MIGCLEAETRDKQVPNRREAANPRRLTSEDEPRQQLGIGRRTGRQLDRESIDKVRRRVSFGDPRLWRKRHGCRAMVFGCHVATDFSWPTR